LSAIKLNAVGKGLMINLDYPVDALLPLIHSAFEEAKKAEK